MIQRDRERGGSQVSLLASPFEALVLARRGRIAEAASRVTEFLPRAREAGDPQVLTPALAAAAVIEEAAGDRAAAVRLIEEFDEKTRDRPPRAANLPDALRVCVAAGAIDLAERLFDATPTSAARHQYSVLTGRAVVAEARGELAGAEELYLQAAARWAEYGSVPERAQTLFGRGRCLVRLGYTDVAREPLEEARRIFRQLGAVPHVAETDALLDQTAAARTAK